MMKTGVPTSTRSYRSSMSQRCMRMHPCDAAVPMDEFAVVPWILIPGALMFSARVPSGLLGPGPMA